MTLQEIEEIVLMNIGSDRYSSLSVDTNAEKAEDFGILHKCVLLSREEIKIHCDIPTIYKRSSSNATASGVKAYNLPTDFDIPVKVRYRTSSSEFDLDRVYPSSLIQKLGGNLTTTTGTPSMYMIFGESSNRAQIELYLIPDTATDEFDVEYKPILSNITTSTSYDTIMAKYPLTVIKLATAYGFWFMRKDQKNFTDWYTLGASDFSLINQREVSADSNYKEIPDSLTMARRMARPTR